MMRFRFLLPIALSFAIGAGAESRPATAPSEPLAGTPKEALQSLNIAQRDGDSAAMQTLFSAEDHRGEQLIAAMAEYAAALAKLHDAADHTYGADGAIIVTGDIKAASAQGLAAIDKANVTIDGNNAVVKYAGATDAPIKLMKVAGRWKLPVSQLFDGADPKAGDKGVRELLAEARIARTMADEIVAGKFREGANKAREVWRSRLLEPGKAEKP